MNSTAKEEWTIDELVGLLQYLNPDGTFHILGNSTIQSDVDPRSLDYPEDYGYHPEAGYIYSPTSADAFAVTKLDCTCW